MAVPPRARRSMPRPAVEAVEARRLMASIVVANNNDSGVGSLRAAIASAAANDTIDLTARRGTIGLVAPLTISKPLTFTGPGTGLLTLSGNDYTSGFYTSNGSRITLSGLTLAHFTKGSSAGAPGGAVSSVYATGASFAFDHVNFEYNAVTTNNASMAGAISMTVAGTVIMADCSVTHNTGGGSGGGVYVNGGDFAAVRCTFAYNQSYGGGAGLLLSGDTRDRLVNCTIAYNTVDARNSGVYGVGVMVASNGPFTMINCSVVNNTTTGTASGISGGGMYLQMPGGQPTRYATLINTIIAGNANGSRGDLYALTAAQVTASYCLIGDGTASGQTHGVNGNLVGTHASPIDAGVGALADFGGVTPTAVLRSDSPAIDAGTSTAGASAIPPADQRENARIGATDIGAVEATPGPAVFISTATATATAEAACAVTLQALDPNGDTLTLTAAGLPAWATFTDNGDGTATLSGTPALGDIGSTPVILTASDGTFTTQQTLTLKVVHAPAPPEFVSTPSLNLTAGVPWRYDVVTTDPNGDPLTFTAPAVPAWLSWTDHGDGTATLAGTPGEPNVGNFILDLVVADGTTMVHQGISMRIAHAPAAPVITGTGSGGTAATVGQPYTRNFLATDINDDAVTFSAVSKPAWLTLTDNGDGTAALSGTPGAGNVGSVTVVIAASDGTRTSQYSYTLTVGAAYAAPTFTTTWLSTVGAGTAYHQTVVAQGAPGKTLAITALVKPAWLTVTDNGNGTATLGGTPGRGDVGSAAVSLRVSDGTGSDTHGFTIGVAMTWATPTIVSTPNGFAFTGRAYAETVQARDANGDPLTFLLHEAPPWLVLRDNGDGTATLTGTPAEADLGITRVRLSVNNGHFSAEQAFDISSASPTRFATLGDHGALRIAGSEEADDVVVFRRGEVVRAILGGETMNFAASAVASIEYAGLGGDDVFTSNVGTLPVFADGGAGNDTIVGSGGGDTLRGGDGDDVIDGADGRDSIYGDAGDDRLAGSAAADTLFGGDGRDTLDGGAGRDLLRGEGGRDLFFALDGAADRVLGGLPNQGDRAWLDRRDLFSDVKRLIA